MAAGDSIETVIRKPKIFHVNKPEQKRKTGGSVPLRTFDHAGSEVDPDHVAIGCDRLSEPVAERSWPAGQVEDSLSWHHLEPLAQGGPGARFAAGHHTVLPPPVSRGGS